MSFYLPQALYLRSSPKYFLVNYLLGGLGGLPAMQAFVIQLRHLSCLLGGTARSESPCPQESRKRQLVWSQTKTPGRLLKGEVAVICRSLFYRFETFQNQKFKNIKLRPQGVSVNFLGSEASLWATPAACCEKCSPGSVVNQQTFRPVFFSARSTYHTLLLWGCLSHFQGRGGRVVRSIPLWHHTPPGWFLFLAVSTSIGKSPFSFAHFLRSSSSYECKSSGYKCLVH